MEKHQFKPFDQVLVRNSDKGKWLISHYGYETTEVERQVHVCSTGASFYQCIPYNEETAHLVGTTEEYHPEEPKEWEVRSSNGLLVEKYTSSELQNFINIAVINNKDITNFSITRIF